MGEVYHLQLHLVKIRHRKANVDVISNVLSILTHLTRKAPHELQSFITLQILLGQRVLMFMISC